VVYRLTNICALKDERGTTAFIAASKAVTSQQSFNLTTS